MPGHLVPDMEIESKEGAKGSIEFERHSNMVIPKVNHLNVAIYSATVIS
jgi:hypothetical protein